MKSAPKTLVAVGADPGVHESQIQDDPIPFPEAQLNQMKTVFVTRRATLLIGALLLAACSGLPVKPTGKEVVMMTSGGFAAASDGLKAGFERSTGISVKTVYGSSMGGAADSIPSRLARNEPFDVVILARSSLDQLVVQGKVLPGSQVDLVHSLIGFSVKKGSPKPDISTPDAVKRTLLAAPSIAYSASASGTYYETEMLKTLGIEEQVKPKSRRILSERVGTIVARGEAALGMQQVSELLPIEGIDFVGVLPPPLQRVTVFSAGISTAAHDVESAKALIGFYTSAEAVPVIEKAGLEPASSH